MKNNKLPKFFEIGYKDKIALIDPENKVCLGISRWMAENLGNDTIQSKIYPIWDHQVKLQKKLDSERERINTVYLMVTRQCNLNCDFCAIDARRYDVPDKEFTVDDVQKKIVPFFQKCRPHKLIVTGGEPLIKKRIVEIIEILHQGVQSPIILQSNGLIVDQNIVDRLKGKVAEIDFSTGHMFKNEFMESELKKHIKMCQGVSINVVLSFIYEKTNKTDLYKVIDIAAKYDTSLLINFVSPVGRAKNNSFLLTELDRMEIYLDIAKYIYNKGYKGKLLSNIAGQKIQIKKACGGYGQVMAVYPAGNIYMCQSLTDEEYRIGNILTDAPEAVMDVIEKKLQNEKIKKAFCVDYKEMCNRCEYKYVCSGKCPVSNVQDDYNCYFLKNMYNYQLFQKKNNSSVDELKEYILFLEKIIEKYKQEQKEK